MLSYLDRFKEGIFQLVETGEPEPSSVAPPAERGSGCRDASPSGIGGGFAGPSRCNRLRRPKCRRRLPLPAPAPDIPSLYREAKEDYNAGRLDEMERKLRQIIETDPNEVQAYHLLGTVYQEKKEPDRALRIFADAAALLPKEAILHYDLGFLYFKKGVDSLAAQELTLAMKLSPQAPEAEGAQEILQKLGQRPRPTASLPKKKMEPPRPPAAPPILAPKPETREEPVRKAGIAAASVGGPSPRRPLSARRSGTDPAAYFKSEERI
ncbi:MAG: tetratricopeptide repeat protein [Candidatus Manganitrophus sp.]|nr:tetratricopeptide repeat protein [Candidatus Manganitrophus sp.]